MSSTVILDPDSNSLVQTVPPSGEQLECTINYDTYLHYPCTSRYRVTPLRVTGQVDRTAAPVKVQEWKVGGIQLPFWWRVMITQRRSEHRQGHKTSQMHPGPPRCLSTRCGEGLTWSSCFLMRRTLRVGTIQLSLIYEPRI